MKLLSQSLIKNKIVLLRIDLDLSDGGDFRLEAGIPTIKYLLENTCKIIIVGHLGRPEGKVSDNLSLFPVFEKLNNYLLGKEESKFKFITSVLSKETKEIIKQARFGEIIMLENLRFYPGEELNDSEFAEYLASLADIFVNDAFAVCHRKHASIAGIPKFLPSFAGLRLEKEIEILTRAMRNPEKPAIAVIGGAKIETKLPCMKSLARIYDTILIGGKLGFSFCHPEERSDDGSIQLKNGIKNVMFPIDYIGKKKFDIGDKTIEKYKKIISGAKTIVWNGPMGKFEDSEFIRGTKEIADAIIESGAYSIIGGGDTIAAISKLGVSFEKFGWVSTGGGAMLEFMAGKKLAGIEALMQNLT